MGEGERTRRAFAHRSFVRSFFLWNERGFFLDSPPRFELAARCHHEEKERERERERVERAEGDRGMTSVQATETSSRRSDRKTEVAGGTFQEAENSLEESERPA